MGILDKVKGLFNNSGKESDNSTDIEINPGDFYVNITTMSIKRIAKVGRGMVWFKAPVSEISMTREMSTPLGIFVKKFRLFDWRNEIKKATVWRRRQDKRDFAIVKNIDRQEKVISFLFVKRGSDKENTELSLAEFLHRFEPPLEQK